MSDSGKRVLMCVLDWGLGHATRSVVAIRALLAKGHEVEIASSGGALTLLKLEFPQLVAHELPGYNVRYSARAGVFFPLLLRSAAIMDTIRKEHDATEKLVIARNIHAIISDNRYGCWSRKAPCAIITHQLSPKLPTTVGFLSSSARRTVARFISNFTHCWIPDEEANMFSGELSQSAAVDARFIGILSRMKRMDVGAKSGVLALISGPEPQRALFENMISRQLREGSEPFVLVRGVPGDTQQTAKHVYHHLPVNELNELIARSALVICRPGYSSVMDLAATGAKAHFVPTPGQTEQEYLARRLQGMGIAGFQRQSDFSMSEVFRSLEQYTGFRPVAPASHLLSKEIDILLRDE